jgi:hypothetical protein
METPALTGENRRGRRLWPWAFVLLAACPLFLFAASNLWLNVSGKTWIAGKITQKTTLDTQIGGASWSPWNGLSLRNIELSQPEALKSSVKKPLARIDQLRIQPVWKALFRQTLEVKSMELDSPEIVLPVQILAFLSQSAQPAPEPQLPAPVPPLPSVPSPQAPPMAENPAILPSKSAEATPPKPVAPPRPTAWIEIRNGNFSLVSAGLETPLIEFLDFTTRLPVSGDAAKSSLLFESIRILGTPAVSKLDAPVQWQPPLLTLGPVENEIHGMKFRLLGQLASAQGLPSHFEILIPQQAPQPVDFPGGIHGQAETFAARARFQGLLLAPPTWQGDFITESQKPVFARGEEITTFDRGSSVFVLRGGTLACLDARLIGEELSLLGNGKIATDGQVAAVLRTVAAPEKLVENLRKILPGLQGTPSLTPLSTPQRAALDLEATGRLGEIQLRLGKDGPVINPSAPEPSPHLPQ